MNSQTTNHPPTSTVTHPSCSAVSGNVPDSVPASSTVSSNDRNFHFIVRNADDGDVVDSILRALTKDYPKFRFWIGTGGIDCSTTVPSSTSASVRKDRRGKCSIERNFCTVSGVNEKAEDDEENTYMSVGSFLPFVTFFLVTSTRFKTRAVNILRSGFDNKSR